MADEDIINNPTHYTSLGAACPGCGHLIECIDVVELMSYNAGTAVAYLWRHPWKNGIEDLRKAVWHIQREIGRLEGKHAGRNG